MKPVEGSAALPVPIIDTERLRLRLLGAEHASICAAYALRNKDFHAASAPRRTDEFYSSEYWAKRLAGSVQRFNQGTSIEFFIFDRLDDGVVLGECAFDGFAFGVFQACYLGARSAFGGARLCIFGSSYSPRHGELYANESTERKRS